MMAPKGTESKYQGGKSSSAAARDSCKRNAKPRASQGETAEWQTLHGGEELPLKMQTAVFSTKKEAVLFIL